MGSQKSHQAASMCCPGRRPSESCLCENEMGLGQAGFSLCGIRLASSSLSRRSPQWPRGRSPQSQNMPHHVPSHVVFSSAKALTAAPLLREQPIFLTTHRSPQLCCSQTSRDAARVLQKAKHRRPRRRRSVQEAAVSQRSAAHHRQLHQSRTGVTASSPHTHESSIPDVSPHGARRGLLTGPSCSCSS